MSAAIEPGMWVECLVNRTSTTAPPRHLVCGRIYLVEAVGLTPANDDHPNHPWVRLAGVPLRPGKLGFRAEWFRPIYGGKSEIIEALKQPAPDREREDA